MAAGPPADVKDYLREWAMPHVLCPGCAHGIVLRSCLEAISQLGLDQDKVAMVAGIGCSSRLAAYTDFCTLHGTHGRAPAFATGLKLARPELEVLVVTGDGDALAIGGNHLIHAARRNIDITVMMLSNSIYGMTGGQAAPTTPEGAVASTTPAGNHELPFDACKLLIGAGASYVARTLAATPFETTRTLADAMAHRGFSFVEVISDCPEYYGRYNQMGRGADMLISMTRDEDGVAVPLASKRFVDHIPSSADPAGLTTGVLHQHEAPVYSGVRRQERG
ncbi:MAG: 2-oxoacid:ferredoxin oxidoreductase subunit beta [Actinomycetia bacterium]|nr:2-oxoacid:ferredoxin oxidoreductase subunit beta [Actinomycetes bacterium]